MRFETDCFILAALRLFPESGSSHRAISGEEMGFTRAANEVGGGGRWGRLPAAGRPQWHLAPWLLLRIDPSSWDPTWISYRIIMDILQDRSSCSWPAAALGLPARERVPLITSTS